MLEDVVELDVGNQANDSVGSLEIGNRVGVGQAMIALEPQTE